MRIDPEFKKKWTEALRSGEYKQGNGFLCKPAYPEGFRYCCLGVACKVEGIDDGAIIMQGMPNRHPEIITQEVNPFLAGTDSQTDLVLGVLSGMNDEGTPFSKIADWIDENL